MIIRVYKNYTWKPVSRHHQFHRAFKNGMFGFKGGSPQGWRIAKVRFLRHSKRNARFYMKYPQYSFGRGIHAWRKI